MGQGTGLGAILDGRLDYHDRLTERFVPLLTARPGVVAVVLYGSCLFGHGAADSEPDFFVIVESLRRYHGGLALAALSSVLPPATFHVRAGETFGKACVLSVSQLVRETSRRAADLHHLGRFSKRVGLVWARDDAARALVREAQRTALETLAPRVLTLLPTRFSVDEFITALLGLSYRGEPRVVEPGKIDRLFAVDPGGYRAVARALLAAQPGVTLDGDQVAQPPALPWARAELRWLIARSRRRAILRIPRNLLTFDGWLDYAVRKIERHTGRRFPLSDRERRHPLLLGWPRLWQLRREGVLR